MFFLGILVVFVGVGFMESFVCIIFNGSGYVIFVDFFEGDVGGGDGQSGGDVGDFFDFGEVGFGVIFFGGVGLVGQEDKVLLVGFQVGNVGGEGFFGEVLVVEVDSDVDGGSYSVGNISFLL